MSKSRKKGAVYGIIAVMLCVAVYLNWSYVQTPDDLLSAGQIGSQTSTSNKTKQGDDGEGASSNETTEQTSKIEAVTTSDYFTESRLSREQSRDEAISILKDTLASDTSDEESKQLANSQISEMADASVAESTIESLIKAKGYQDAVVFIGSDSVNVIVAPPESGFTETDASKISDIVVAETSFRPDQITIVEAG